MSRVRTFSFAALLCLAGCNASSKAMDVAVSPVTVKPGDTVRVEIHGVPARKLKCRFEGKDVPFFSLSLDKKKTRALIGLNAEWKPGKYEIEIAEKKWFFRDTERTVSIAVKNKDFPKENLKLAHNKTQLAQDPKQGEAKAKIEKILTKRSSDQKWQGKFVWPVKGKVTTVYGVRRTVNKTMAWPYHKGIDIYAREGTEVRAPNAGRVVLAEPFPVQGRMIVLDHGQGVMTAYLHLSSIDIEEGKDVAKGQLIGKVGADGFATGPHLHWGLYVHGEPVDPKKWMETEF